MAKDPVCGICGSKADSMRHTMNGNEYFFCGTQCLNEFREPEKELKKLKIHVALSVALTIPIVFLSLPHMLPVQFGHFLPMDLLYNSSYIMLVMYITTILGWLEIPQRITVCVILKIPLHPFATIPSSKFEFVLPQNQL